VEVINVGTQYGLNDANNLDFYDGTQYLNFDVDDEQESIVQENADKVYLLIKRLLYMKLNIIPFVYITESLYFYVCCPLH